MLLSRDAFGGANSAKCVGAKGYRYTHITIWGTRKNIG